MDSSLEAAGALATAAAAANAIDPDEPRRPRHVQACLNCGAEVTGAYCSACGQKAHLHRSILHAAEEFLHGITHFDSKLWNTLPLLFLRPGRLTRDYVHGRRARYVAPVALFLLTVFSMFLLFGFLPSPVDVPGAVKIGASEGPQAEAALAARIKALDAEIAAAEKDPMRADELSTMRMVRETLIVTRDKIRRGEGEASLSIGEALTAAQKTGGLSVDLGDQTLNQKAMRALSDPELVFYKMKQKGYKLSFLLVPLSLPWMILLFAWRKDVQVYDHVVFLLYSISFMSMLAMAAAVAATYLTLPELVWSLLLLLPPLHIYAQLKEGYALGRVSAIWRTLALSTFALATLVLYFAGILLLGLLD
jgi:hypothetical protein